MCQRTLLAVTPFLDFGYAWNRGRPSPPIRTLSSIGLGIEWAPLPDVEGAPTLTLGDVLAGNHPIFVGAPHVAYRFRTDLDGVDGSGFLTAPLPPRSSVPRLVLLGDCPLEERAKLVDA